MKPSNHYTCKLIRKLNENADKCKGGLKLAAVECNYKEIDRQLKDQFIHRLNDNDTFVEIIRELTQTKKNVKMWQVIKSWNGQKVKAQKAQSVIINRLNETKDFDKIKTVRRGQRQSKGKLWTHAKVPAKESCSYCGSIHPPRWCLVYGMKCAECGKINHFREVSRNIRSRMVHNLEQEPDQYQEEEDHIDVVNINSINSYNKH